MSRLFLCLCVPFSLVFFRLHAQTNPDSARLDEVVIRAYLSAKPALTLPTSTALLGQRDLKLQQQTSLVQAVNTIPGIRMEERSPGSYRFAIRGNLLRSPFGVRNVKIYAGDFPLTDAGGNTYLNLIDPEAITGMEILKGPDGSLFGANSGGVVVLQPSTGDSLASAGIQGGSFGLFRQHAALKLGQGRFHLPFFQGYQRADGYRQNSRMNRIYVQATPQWDYAENRSVKSYLFYSDLNYRTPGGLTQAQFDTDPGLARPGTAAVPGPVAQKAGIQNQTLYGGVSHDATFGRVHHVLAVFGATTDFANPFLTNYEVHDERNFGLRTYAGINGGETESLAYTLNAGLEWQQNQSLIANYGNRSGVRDTLQAADQIRTRQQFYFTQLSLQHRKWIFETAVSLNFYGYRFSRPDIDEVQEYTPGQIRFSPQLMPRFSLSYALNPAMALRATVSRGYSPPATAEVRASDARINTALLPENGWNYETGFRWYSANRRFTADASVYYYRLSQAIVRRLNDAGIEYFTNAGGTKQPGAELQLSGWLVQQRATGAIRGLQLQSSLSITRYRFGNYISNTTSFEGNRVTGTPPHTLVTGLFMAFPKNISLFIQDNFTGKIPLNDANTTFANRYNLLNAKAGYSFRLNRSRGEIFAGVDNALDQTYSLGNDINAFGGRYFNAAARRNWFAGLNVYL
ncbi:MAG: TonB-dependent receptor [Mucilaginibacter polytrichastri]|nr:TonB-dependent receptor [Mucilaginibacter polytrichastri]